MGPKSNDWFPYKKWGQRHGEESHVKMVAEIKVMCLQAKEYQQSAEGRRQAWGIFSIRTPRRNQSCLGLDCGLLASWTIRESISVLSHPVCGSPRNLRQWPMERGLLNQHKMAHTGLHPRWLRVNRNLLGDPQMTLIQFLFVHSQQGTDTEMGNLQ